MRTLLVIITGFLLYIALPNAPSESHKSSNELSQSGIYSYLRDTTVLVRVMDANNIHMRTSGTGSLIKRGEDTYLITAAHVVASAKPDDNARWQVYVCRPKTKDYEYVGEDWVYASVENYSPADTGHDIAWCKVMEKNYGTRSTVFYTDKAPPPLYSVVWHCGNYFGCYFDVIRSGVIDAIGIRAPNVPHVSFDNASVTSFPGSSGGPIVLEDGRYIGMLARGRGETLSNYIPIRRIRQWARDEGLESLIFTGAREMPKAK